MIVLITIAFLFIVILVAYTLIEATKTTEKLTDSGPGQEVMLQPVRIAHGHLDSPKARARLPTKNNI